MPSNTETPRMITRSPVQRAGLTFERAFDLGGDPAAVEPSWLRRHPLVVHPALVDARCVERDVVAQHLVLRLRRLVAPRRVARIAERPVRGLALPLAPRRRLRSDELP